MSDLVLFRAAGKTWVQGRTRFLSDGKHLPFQLKVDQSKADLIEASGLVSYEFCERGSCGLPYKISLVKPDPDSPGFELSEEVPSILPGNFDEFLQLKGKFDSQPRVVEGPVYLVSDENRTEASFPELLYQLGNFHSSEIKMEASPETSAAYYEISLTLKHWASLEYYPQPKPHICSRPVCSCRFQPPLPISLPFSPSHFLPTPVIEEAYLVAPSGKRAKLDFGEASAREIIRPNVRESRFSTRTRLADFVEEPVNGTWRIDLKVNESEFETPVAYAVVVEGKLGIVPIVTEFNP